MQLSPHFSLKEFTVTHTGLDNKPDAEHMINLHITAFGMEQVRFILGRKPIYITSAYRNRKVNAAVGGVSNSDHALGLAVDFRHGVYNAKQAASLLENSDLLFDQLILERNDSIIHLSFNSRFRRQILRQPGGPGTSFYKGLE